MTDFEDKFGPASALLPHAPPMILIDSLVEHAENTARARLTLREDSPFYLADQGMPAHVALEWMAQTCGLYVGYEAQQAKRPIQLGFLLGTRRFESHRAWFAAGETLDISVKLVLSEGGMGVFDCTLFSGETVEATATLTLYKSDQSLPESSGSFA